MQSGLLTAGHSYCTHADVLEAKVSTAREEAAEPARRRDALPTRSSPSGSGLPSPCTTARRRAKVMQGTPLPLYPFIRSRSLARRLSSMCIRGALRTGGMRRLPLGRFARKKFWASDDFDSVCRWLSEPGPDGLDEGLMPFFVRFFDRAVREAPNPLRSWSPGAPAGCKRNSEFLWGVGGVDTAPESTS